MVLRIIFLAFVVYAGMIESTTAWAFGDVGIGLITWGNMLFLLTCLPIAKALLKDFEEQKDADKEMCIRDRCKDYAVSCNLLSKR